MRFQLREKRFLLRPETQLFFLELAMRYGSRKVGRDLQ